MSRSKEKSGGKELALGNGHLRLGRGKIQKKLLKGTAGDGRR